MSKLGNVVKTVESAATPAQMDVLRDIKYFYMCFKRHDEDKLRTYADRVQKKLADSQSKQMVCQVSGYNEIQDGDKFIKQLVQFSKNAQQGQLERYFNRN